MKKIYIFVVPSLLLGIFQLGGCARTSSIEPPPAGGVYRSASAGASFEQSVSIQGQPGEYIADFSLGEISHDPRDPNTIYIAAGGQGVVRSQNGGESWQVITTPLANTIDTLALQNGTLVASGLDGDGQGFIIRSLDNGQSWHTVLTVPIPVEQQRLEIIKGPEQAASVVISLHHDPFSADRIYAGSNLGTIFIGEQSAKTWRTFHTIAADTLDPLQSQQQAILELIPSPHTPGELLFITEQQELFRLQGGQQTEIEVPEFIDTAPPFGVSGRKRAVLSAAFIKEFPDAIIAGVEDGVVITRDGGVTWIELSVPVEASRNFNSIVVRVSPTNVNRILVGINSVIYRSEDGGQSWSTFALGLPSRAITDISINPNNAAKVLLVTTLIRT